MFRKRSRSFVLSVVLLALATPVAAALAASGTERGTGDERRHAKQACALTCHGEVALSARSARWQSRERFASHDALHVRVLLGGRELEAEPLSSCSAVYYGRGAMAKVNTCRPRIRVKVASVRNKPARLRIAYRRAR